MLDEMYRRIQGYLPQSFEVDPRFPEAAVLMPITRSETPELVLTLRASGLSTHGGEVAFPGGRRDPEDRHLIHTALREAEEEIGLALGLVGMDRVCPGLYRVPAQRWRDCRRVQCAAGIFLHRPARNDPPH